MNILDADRKINENPVYMKYIHRFLEKNIRQALQRDKSILLLGPRQTGKTTLIQQQIQPELSYSFASATIRQRYEQNPALLEGELLERIKTFTQKPVIFIDEVQKIPRAMDVAQYLIDNKLTQFILTGSSARKLRTGRDINLLPGRVVVLTMAPLLYKEFPNPPKLEEILLYGTLPGIMNEADPQLRETDLLSYVTTYLEEEIRAEAAVRNVGSFTRFLTIAAGESGKQLNFSRLSQDVGIADTTIANYYQILEDCLIVHRIDPITQSQTKRRLIRSPRYLFFDLGIRRVCANEGVQLPQKMFSELFEHYVGNELVHLCQLASSLIKVKYWRDSAGPEVDYVLDAANHYIPIEVKWSEQPDLGDARHLKKFMQEYPAEQAYIVCRTPHRYRLDEKILAIPWQELNTLFEGR